MKINKKTLDFCSKNLLIDFTDDEKIFLYKELEDVIDSLEKVKNMNLDKIVPTNYPIKNKNSLREDDIWENNANDYVKEIKNYQDGYVKVRNE